MENSQNREIKSYSIQALRATAALFVVFDHTITQFNIYHHLPGLSGKILYNIQGIGTVGVYIFFIVSGYIMSLTTFNKSWNKSEALLFIKKRALRIYPVYWIWLTLLIVFWLSGLVLKQHDYSFNKIVASYFLLPYSDVSPSRINPVLGQGWTLIYEMFYYLLFTVLISLSIKKSQAPLILTLVFSFFILIGKNSVTKIPVLDFFMASTIFYFFVLGMAIYKWQDLILRLYSTKSLSYFSVFTCIICFYLIVFSNASQGYKNIPMGLMSLGLFLLFFVSKSNYKNLSVLGDASYSLYLSHGFIVMGYGVVCKTFNLSLPMLFISGVVTIFASAAIGVLGYYLIERKVQFFVNRIFMPSRRNSFI